MKHSPCSREKAKPSDQSRFPLSNLSEFNKEAESMLMNIGLFLTKRALINPNKLGVVCEDKRLTFRELNHRANRVANAVRGLGVQKGDRVAVLMMNSVEYNEAYYGIAKTGAVMVPLNWRLVASELEYIIKDSGARHLIYGTEFTGVVEEMIPNLELDNYIHQGENTPAGHIHYEDWLDKASPEEPEIGAEGDDVQFIMYTSGTTGLPKGAMITHRNMFMASCNLNFSLDWSGSEIFLLVLPMFHIGALAPATVNMHSGATSIVMKAFDPEGMFKCIESERVTSFLAVPSMLTFMLQVPEIKKYDISSVNTVTSGASPVPVSLIEAYTEYDINIIQLYGLTEAAGPVTTLNPEEALTRIGSCGKPFFHMDVKIVDDDGNQLPPGEQGELITRGESVMKGYWNLPDATAETIKNGWLHTGDIAKVDEEGYYYITDRKKDMIISGGENVYPAEIEGVLYSHPDILEAAVIGMPSDEWGESPLAVVVPKEGAGLTEQQVIDYCNGRLARYKMPKAVVFTQEIPRNPTGKALKWKLREEFVKQ
jgi:O-succinylbenzoate-CoA ligase